MCNDETSQNSSTAKRTDSSSGTGLSNDSEKKDQGNSRYKDSKPDERTDEQKKEADRKYDEAIEEEYAKREGGA